MGAKFYFMTVKIISVLIHIFIALQINTSLILAILIYTKSYCRDITCAELPQDLHVTFSSVAYFFIF